MLWTGLWDGLLCCQCRMLRIWRRMYIYLTRIAHVYLNGLKKNQLSKVKSQSIL